MLCPVTMVENNNMNVPSFLNIKISELVCIILYRIMVYYIIQDLFSALNYIIYVYINVFQM